MSDVIKGAAAESTQLGWLMGWMTVVFVAVFVGWALWAWLPSRKGAMDAAARIPLDNDES